MGSESRYRLAWIVCLLLLVGFIGNSFSNYMVSRHNVRKTITESSLPLTSDNIYSVIQRDLLRPIFISSMMANDAFLREWILQGEKGVEPIQRYLSEILNEYKTVTSFLVSDITRNYYYAGGILKQVREDEPRDEWYFRVREMTEPFEINVDPDLANQDAMTIFINYRVFDFDGNYIGATGTGLTIHRVNELIEEYEERFGRQIFFAARNGKIIISPTKSKLQSYSNIREVEGLNEHADVLLQGKIDTLTYQKDGDTYFLNSRFVPELDWFLMVEQTEDFLLAPLRENFYINLAMALVITGIVGFVCISAIQRHQNKLQEAAKDLAKANADLSELNREKDDFLSLVAHDLRNPLNGILGFSEELKLNLKDADPKAKEYLGYIRSAGHQMLDLIGDILNLSFIEGFHGKLELKPCNWNQLAMAACDRFHSQAHRKNIRLDLKLDEKADIDTLTRQEWMDICLNNLVSNAIKYSPQNSTVHIETRHCGNQIEFSVRDEGPGLSPEEIRKLFGKFVRLSPKPTGEEGSTGLGLYIVRKMCQRLGAEVKVQSQPGKGSLFTIQHPLC